MPSSVTSPACLALWTASERSVHVTLSPMICTRVLPNLKQVSLAVSIKSTRHPGEQRGADRSRDRCR
ncbi:protein of unknown function (plasmid) [Azospirillum lipoferum 4B]|uniref:Uncharacterized protein n=1 Tax=Azospirillum lipoferum (strain 4B) TaxID=862719 RepID=G7ZIK6_AZOL4|nr:protein of unknown function [Azospirillum lipoferum 4B]